MLNPAYPSSWWVTAFSSDLRPGEVIPIRALERDLVLWRNEGGGLVCQSAHCPHLGAHLGYGGEVVKDTLRCPFHGWQYDGGGAVVVQPGVELRGTPRACLETFPVIEYLGAVFLWNGLAEPDHPVPDPLAERGLAGGDVSCFHNRFRLPIPAKSFLENTPDANHFSAVHGACEYAETEVIEETPTEIVFRSRFVGVPKYFSWRRTWRAYRRGELLIPGVPGQGYVVTTYGSGIHVFQFVASHDAPATGILKHLESAILISAWTPVEADSHTFHAVVAVPSLRGPVGVLLRPFLGGVITRFLWGGVMQDTAIMMHRNEPARPAYNRLDRALVRFRRFWDNRVLEGQAGAEDDDDDCIPAERIAAR